VKRLPHLAGLIAGGAVAILSLAGATRSEEAPKPPENITYPPLPRSVKPPEFAAASGGSIVSLRRSPEGVRWYIHSEGIPCRPAPHRMEPDTSEAWGDFDRHGRYFVSEWNTRRTTVYGRPAKARTKVQIDARRRPGGHVRGTFNRVDRFIEHGKTAFTCTRTERFTLGP
jgi:hypothetical protein